MEAGAKTQRRRAQRKPAGSSLIHVEMKDGIGNPRWVTANLVDVIGGGCGLALLTVLKSGSTVVVRGKLGESRTLAYKAEVRWCIAENDGTFRAGLEFLDSRSTFDRDREHANSIHPATLDCYEVMQLSPNADAETVSRVYRLLAFRYHPDNAKTGNSEMFLRLSEAHQILSDPQKRASYDLSRPGATPLRAKNVEQPLASPARPGEKRRTIEFVRAAYLGVAYLERSPGAVSWEG
jgi:DnaJ domain/PilZ domain